jgi:uncharacterized protein (DUF2147 family)
MTGIAAAQHVMLLCQRLNFINLTTSRLDLRFRYITFSLKMRSIADRASRFERNDRGRWQSTSLSGGSRMRAQLVAFISVIASALLLGAGHAATTESTAAGLWEQVDHNGQPNGWFLISEHDGVYNANLVKIFARPGRSKNLLCTSCFGDRKNAPWLGLTIVKGMQQEGLDYENGTILDPKTGAEYFGRMRLSPDGQKLTVRGYLGVDPLGGKEAWRRLPDSALNEVDPALTASLRPT